MHKYILWRCRRGTKELDLLLECYYKQQHAKLSHNEEQLFLELLDLNDEMLTAWLIEGRNAEAKFSDLVFAIRNNFKLQ